MSKCLYCYKPLGAQEQDFHKACSRKMFIQRSGNDFVLSPAYDLVSTALVNPADTEDLALSLNGKKNKITRKDFTHVLTSMDLDPKQQENIFKKMEHAGAKWRVCIQESFLSASYKQVYTELLHTRFARLEMKGI